jgi:hypothetical protein
MSLKQYTVRRPARQNALVLALSLLTLIAFAAPSRSDIVFQNQTTGQMVNWLTNGVTLGDHGFLPATGTPIWKVVGTGDFDGDGHPDLLFQNQNTGELIFWQMNGYTYVQWHSISPSVPGSLDWKVVTVGDLDGDGKPDIVLQNQTTGQLIYWLMDGAALRSYAFLPDPGSPDWKVVGSADFNRDGKLDLLFQNQQTGQLVYWLLNRTTLIGIGAMQSPGSASWRLAGIDDFNGDGKPDLLFQNQQTGKLVYWLLDGASVTNMGFTIPDNAGSSDWNVAVIWAPQSHGPAPVNLGTAGNYVILSKSGVSNVPNSAITGNIGVSPIAASAITGFSLTPDPSGTFSTSSQVTGKIYAANYASPTPSNLTTAIGDMQTAYTDAAGRTTPDFTELGSGNIGGKILTPGLYKWSSAVTIPSDVVLSGHPNDVWIFQIAGGITQASGVKVILTGGALAKNVFWQVAGVVDLGTTSHMEGEILSQTSISVKTGASVNGRLLAQTAVSLQSNTIVQK